MSLKAILAINIFPYIYAIFAVGCNIHLIDWDQPIKNSTVFSFSVELFNFCIIITI